MSEYWKSVPRKFCEFCKCWITDNKPSVEFHERGKRHKENVELKLKEVRKKSLQNSLDDEQTKAEMKKMEDAALEAFKKDLKNNPELAAQYGVCLDPKPKHEKPETELKKVSSNQSADVSVEGKESEWYEAISEEGHHYYWSTLTGESRWEPPNEYVSLQEQEKIKSTSKSKEDKNSDSLNKNSETATEATSEEDSKPDSSTRVDPSNCRSAYGSWEVVKEIELPVLFNESSAPPVLEDIPLPTEFNQEDKDTTKSHKPKFKERTVTSLGSGSEALTAFKKRKIASGARNIRQKDSYD